MSAPNFTPIQLFRTSTASAIPSAGSLADGELAINLTDERLYFKNAAGVVKLLASNTGSLGTVTSVAASGGTTGLTFSGSPITTSGTLTLGGTLAVANGGTGVTTSTGTGSVVLSNSPTLVTPTLGVASATSIATGKGTVGAVAYGFTTNTNTGMWSPSSDAIAFSTAGSERFRVTSAGNVGIGVTNPSNTLEVAGSSLLRVPSGNAGYGWLSGTTNYSLYLNAADNSLRLFSSVGTAGDKLVVDANGNVGIGTASPGGGANDRQLTLAGSSSAQATFAASGVTNSVGANTTHGYVGTTSNHPFLFTTNNAERMRITAAGDVGIGTSSPLARLNVEGGNILLRGGVMDIGPTAGADGAGRISTARGGDGISGNLIFSTQNTSAAMTEAMRITGAGNVGIGTTTPNFRLESAVAASGAISTPLRVTNSAGAAGSPGQGSQIGFANDSGWGSSLAGAIRSTVTAPANGASAMSFHGWDGSALIERMRIDSAGNVGIGDPTPAAKLRIVGTSGSPQFGAGTSGNAVFINAFDSGSIFMTASATNSTAFGFGAASNIPLFLMTNNTERMRIDASGNVGIGTSSPSGAKLDVAGNIITRVSNDILDTGVFANQGYIQTYNNASGISPIPMRFLTGTAERMRIDSSGNLLVGTTSNASLARVRVENSGNDGVMSQQNAAGGYCFKTNAANNSGTYYHMEFQEASVARGTITSNGSAVSYNTTSDARLKDNIADADDAASLIDAIQVRKFDWKSDGSHQRYGFVAQELVEVAPEAVHQPEDEDQMMGVDYSKLVPMLVKEIQSLRARVAQLEGN